MLDFRAPSIYRGNRRIELRNRRAIHLIIDREFSISLSMTVSVVGVVDPIMIKTDWLIYDYDRHDPSISACLNSRFGVSSRFSTRVTYYFLSPTPNPNKEPILRVDR